MRRTFNFASIAVAIAAMTPAAVGQSDLWGAVQEATISAQAQKPGASETPRLGSTEWSPQIVSASAPQYPRRASTRGLEGRCDVLFQVDRGGFGANFDLDCTDSLFSRATIDTVRDWRFTPWTGSGELSPQFRLPINYSLSGSTSGAGPIERVAPLNELNVSTPNAEMAATEGGLIGIQITPVGQRFFIGQVLAGTPAERAGLRFGDEIIAVNGNSNFDGGMESIMRAMSGPGNTEVDLLVYRTSIARTLEVSMRRMDRDSLARELNLPATLRTDLPVGGGADVQTARLTELFEENFRGGTDVFIYAPNDLNSDARAWLDWYAGELRERGIQVGMSSDFGSDGGFVAARVFLAANRIWGPIVEGADLDIVQARFCGLPIDGVVAASVSNWRRDFDYLQWQLMDNRRRQSAVADSRRASTNEIRNQLRSQINAIETAVRERQPCLAPQIFRYPQGMGPTSGDGEFLDRGFDFGWTYNGARGWNVESTHAFLEIDAPQLGRRPDEYYVEYLAEIASVFSDDTLSVALSVMIETDTTFAMLGMIDPEPPAPAFHAREAQFLRSNYRLMSGHTLLTYLIGRDFDPVLMRRLFTHGVLDFQTAMTARDRFGQVPAAMLAERGIPIEVLEPDFEGYINMSQFEYPEQPTPRMIESAIVGDNLGALSWLIEQDADLTQALDTPGPISSRRNFEPSTGSLTPLEMAAALGRRNIILMLANEVDINHRNPTTGRTALFHAFASETDIDGFPVPRIVGGQVISMSTDEALSIQNLLLSLGADPRIQDNDGQSADAFQRRVSRLQQRRNEQEQARRAEEREGQETLAQWREESRRQMWSAFGQGIASGLRTEGERLAAAERRRRAEEARREALNRPVGRTRSTERRGTSTSQDTSRQSSDQNSESDASTQSNTSTPSSATSANSATDACVLRSSFWHPNHSAYLAEREALVERLDRQREARYAEFEAYDWQSRNRVDRELRAELHEWDSREANACGRSGPSNAIGD